MLKAKQGIAFAEVQPQRDGDAYTYLIESDVGVDIRKSLFYSLAEKNWPLIGMEAMGMSLEDIFIAIVDQSSPKARYERKNAKTRARGEAERAVAKTLVENAGKSSGGQYSALFGDDADSGK